MEIVQERLEREYNIDLIVTAPTVEYKITKTDGTEITIQTLRNFLTRRRLKKSESLG